MKNKIIKKISIISSIVIMVALLATLNISNVAFADSRGGRDGDNNNSGRGNNNTNIQSVNDASRGRGSERMSSSRIINHNSEDDDDEDNRRGRGNNNLNNLNQNNNFQATIQALENLIRQLETRILFLEQRSGVADVIPPVISVITVVNVTRTGAEIRWITNEPATSKVFFSATSPVNLTTSASVNNPSLVINHSLHLGGLTAGTTFHFVIESKDASNNTSISAQQSFATAP